MPSRTGTETRQRTHQINVRLLPEECAAIIEDSIREGVSAPELLRRSYFESGDTDTGGVGHA